MIFVSCGTSNSARTSAAAFMVSQSDLLPIMIDTTGLVLVCIRFGLLHALRPRLSREFKKFIRGSASAHFCFYDRKFLERIFTLDFIQYAATKFMFRSGALAGL